MADVFEDLLEEKPAFDGYLALTDGIIDVLLNMVCFQLHVAIEDCTITMAAVQLGSPPSLPRLDSVEWE